MMISFFFVDNHHDGCGHCHRGEGHQKLVDSLRVSCTMIMAIRMTKLTMVMVIVTTRMIIMVKFLIRDLSDNDIHQLEVDSFANYTQVNIEQIKTNIQNDVQPKKKNSQQICKRVWTFWTSQIKLHRNSYSHLRKMSYIHDKCTQKCKYKAQNVSFCQLSICCVSEDQPTVKYTNIQICKMFYSSNYQSAAFLYNIQTNMLNTKS